MKEEIDSCFFMPDIRHNRHGVAYISCDSPTIRDSIGIAQYCRHKNGRPRGKRGGRDAISRCHRGLLGHYDSAGDCHKSLDKQDQSG